MTRGNPSDLQHFDPEIDRTFLRLVRHHLVPFEHPEHSITGESVHSVIGDFEHPDFSSEYSACVHTSQNGYFRHNDYLFKGKKVMCA